MKRFFVLFLVLLLAGCNINSSVSLADGETYDKNLSTVNGSVTVGSESQLNGNAETVNGSITIGEAATIQDASTVNGSVRIADRVQLQNAEAVNGSITAGTNVIASGFFETVNGKIDIGADSVVESGIASVNGSLILRGAEVGRIETVSGDITLEANSRVNGEILVERSRGWGSNNDSSELVRVVIGANSTVVGPLRFEREVELRIHESATVGEITGAEPVYFNNE